MASLFETLFYGNYAPAQALPSSAYQDKLKACDAYYNKVEEQFGADFFSKMWDAQMDAATEEVIAAYIAGVRFGGRFMLELLQDS